MERICQSCAMPMGNNQLLGTNKDGGKNEDYCVYCFKDGEFTSEETMEQMIESCVPHLVEAVPGTTEASARKMMQEQFPTLKRWQKN